MSNHTNAFDAKSVTSKTEPQWLTIKQSADTWGLHPNTIRNLITRGQLKAYRLGARVIRINANELNALFTDYKAGEFGIWNS